MYLDPGFGSMIVQVIVAAIAGCGVVLYSIRRKLKSIFKRGKPAPDSVENVEEEKPGESDGDKT